MYACSTSNIEAD